MKPEPLWYIPDSEVLNTKEPIYIIKGDGHEQPVMGAE